MEDTLSCNYVVDQLERYVEKFGPLPTFISLYMLDE